MNIFVFNVFVLYIASTHSQDFGFRIGNEIPHPGGIILPTPPEPKQKSWFQLFDLPSEQRNIINGISITSGSIDIPFAPDALNENLQNPNPSNEHLPKWQAPKKVRIRTNKTTKKSTRGSNGRTQGNEAGVSAIASQDVPFKSHKRTKYSKSLDEIFQSNIGTGMDRQNFAPFEQNLRINSFDFKSTQNKHNQFMKPERGAAIKPEMHAFSLNRQLSSGKKFVFKSSDSGFHQLIGMDEESGTHYQKPCSFRPYFPYGDQLQENSYEERLNGAWEVRMCAPGTGYNHTTCGCTNLLSESIHFDRRPIGICRPDLTLKFHGPVLDSSGNNFTVDAPDVVVHDGAAYFNGSTHLFVWRYKGYDYRSSLQITFKFRPEPERQFAIDVYTLVSNCEGDSDPSFGVVFSPHRNTTTFFIQTNKNETKEAMVFQSYTGIWNDIYFRYENGTLIGRVNNEVQGIYVGGHIQIRPDAMVFAECKRYGNFIGQMKDVEVYTKCLPGLDWRVEQKLKNINK